MEMDVMKLPKLDYPRYETTLPWSGKVISYRPYSVKEEKLLMMSASNEEATDEDIARAVIQVIENTCDVDVSTLHPVDVEWAYLKVYSASVSPIVEVTFFNETCSTPECPTEIQTLLNLESATVIGLDALMDAGFVKKSNGWLIMLTSTVGVIMKDIKEDTDFKTDYNVVLDNIKAIFDEEDIIDVASVKREDLIDFVEDIPKPSADKIKEFFKLQPYVSCTLEAKCPVCKVVHTENVRNLTSFFV